MANPTRVKVCPFKVRKGRPVSKTFPLKPDSSYLVGRGKGTYIGLDDFAGFISQAHMVLRVRRRSGEVHVIDLKSTNGSEINGRKILSQDGWVPVHAGDTLNVAGISLIFE